MKPPPPPKSSQSHIHPLLQSQFGFTELFQNWNGMWFPVLSVDYVRGHKCVQENSGQRSDTAAGVPMCTNNGFCLQKTWRRGTRCESLVWNTQEKDRMKAPSYLLRVSDGYTASSRRDKE
jgi:hypothetical protein